MRRKKHKGFSEVHLYKLLPSFITILALCLGISAVRYAIDSKWTIAAGLIIFAGFMDGLDGRIARMLNSTSSFGAQLDSLADLVSFGVAPAIVMYFWKLHEIPYKGVGWGIVLFFIICSAIRLARFNSMLEDKEEKEKMKNFFVGVPMPSAAALLILPLTLTFELIEHNFDYWHIAFYQIIIGILMISRIPTFSFKGVVIKKKFISIIMLIFATLICGIVIEPWVFIPALGLIYMLLIPVSVIAYYKQQ